MLFAVKLGAAFLKSTDVIPASAYGFSTLLSVTPVTPVFPDKSVFSSVSVGFLIMSFFATLCPCLLYASLSVLFVRSPSPTFAVTFTLSATWLAGTSIDPFVTFTPVGLPSTVQLPFVPLFTITFSPVANGISIRFPPFVSFGVTFKFPFCHCPTVGAVGFSSLTPTYTANESLSFP